MKLDKYANVLLINLSIMESNVFLAFFPYTGMKLRNLVKIAVMGSSIIVLENNVNVALTLTLSNSMEFVIHAHKIPNLMN